MLLKSTIDKIFRIALLVGTIATSLPAFASIPIDVTMTVSGGTALWTPQTWRAGYDSATWDWSNQAQQTQTIIYSTTATIDSFAARWLKDISPSNSLVVNVFDANPGSSTPALTFTYSDPIANFNAPYTTISLPSGIHHITFSLTNPDPSKSFIFGFTLGLTGVASAPPPVSSVPEAPASVMFLGGLGLAGVAAWRRKRSATPEVSSRQAFA